MRQGLGLLVVAVLAALLFLPVRGTANPGTASGVWMMLTGFTAVVCAVVGLVLLAAGLFRPDRD